MKNGERDSQLSTGYDEYSRALSVYNDNFPQRQGLFSEEYSIALGMPTTAVTMLETDSGIAKIPQLTEVGAFGAPFAVSNFIKQRKTRNKHTINNEKE